MPTRYLAVILGLLAIASQAAGELQGLELKADVEIPGDRVLLGDVAVITPPAAVDSLGGLDLLPAPATGTPQYVSRGYIRLRLRRAGMTLDGVQFTGAVRVRVTRPRPVRGQTPIHRSGPRPSSTEPTAIVKRGTDVTVVVRKGSLTIATLGELVKDCAVGDVGKFRVTSTRSVVIGRLTGPRTAEVTL